MNKCLKCGSRVKKEKFQYLKAIIEDSTGMIECAIFDETTKEETKNLGEK